MALSESFAAAEHSGIQEEAMEEYRKLVESYRTRKSDDPIKCIWDWHRGILLNQMLRQALTDSESSLDVLTGDNNVLPPNLETCALLLKLTQTAHAKIRFMLLNPEPTSGWRDIMNTYAPNATVKTLEIINDPSFKLEHIIIANDAYLATEPCEFSNQSERMKNPHREISALVRFNNHKRLADVKAKFESVWNIR